MTLHDLERAIWHEAQQVTGRKGLRLKDIHEWNTSEEQVWRKVERGEQMFHLPKTGVWVAVPTRNIIRKCDGCDAKSREVKKCADPFDADVYHRQKMVQLCEDCYNRRCEEV